MTAFKYFQNEWTPVINEYLEKHLTADIDDQKISQIMSYSVMAGGKRLRPLLFLSTLNSLGKVITEKEVKIACGIELIHTYSLIHDDLPAMDNDDYRRGKLTSHKKWGEAEAILAGDALLPLGIQWIAEGSQSAALVEIITKAIGPNGMVGGQYLDINSTNNDSVAEDAEFINRMEWLKTGCLIQASVNMAAIYGEASQVEQVKLDDFAKMFGRAYQIYDDLVDVVETSEEAGKATHKDQEEGKNNTLTLLGIDKSRKELTDLIKQAKDDLNGLNSEVLAGFLDLYKKVL
ncbi:polyprenyl synthetase family protein [Lactobacillus kalixensis]|uniref:Farnesyl diphosphate synthase n=1 Tax=Lactobacillus kalixensis DSM 16043 TaxID=1423763 RepID=A0A0R1U8L7_9LACO|nr:farnesyl diphosphate synthase [Lactobacillus kalixensis]KRL89670.1 geranyltranstransferase [Lactobacillus kalixensis DSM 16043]